MLLADDLTQRFGAQAFGQGLVIWKGRLHRHALADQLNPITAEPRPHPLAD
jgi:hypothetical protein